MFLLLLCWEYNSLRTQTEKIRTLQGQYYEYVDMMKKVLRKKKVLELTDSMQEVEEEGEGLAFQAHDDREDTYEAGANEDDIEVDSFMALNRAPSYLKQSTMSYLKEQQLETLLDRINLHEWQSYTDQVLTSAERRPVIGQRKKSKKKKGTAATNRARSPWGVRRRQSLTGIQFSWPIAISDFWLSSFFGQRKKPNGSWGFHYGIDMAAQRGTPVRASVEGVVEHAGYVSGYGNTVVISHDRIYKTRYAHMDTIFVREKQRVKKGERIGAVGDTGFTIRSGKDASHLHFELYERGKQVNPLYLLPPRK